MERRSFLKIGAGTAGAMLVPVFGNAIAAEDLLNPMATSFKKALADAALNAATKAGASYCDVRIGRYLNQFITTRDLNVENITNTESTGVGIRVIAGGAYGFAATNSMNPDAVAAAVPRGHRVPTLRKITSVPWARGSAHYSHAPASPASP